MKSKEEKAQLKAAKKVEKIAKKQIDVIDMGGAKTVAKKTSYVTTVKRVFAVFTVVWLLFTAAAPLYVKYTYSEPIKKSIVVSMFFDLQRNIAAQYEKLLDGIKKSINLEKPIAVAIEKVKMAEKPVAQVQKATDSAQKVTESAKGLTSLAGKFGVKTGSIDKAIGQAGGTVAKVDSTAKMVNDQLSKVQTELVKISQAEVDKMVDDVIKQQLDKHSGGLGTTLLTNYGVKHVYPWRPSTWPVATKIYNDLEKSDLGVVQILTNTVNKYFGYVAWGLVVAGWLAGLIIWMMVNKRVKLLISPFLVCPRCGHTYTDNRSVFSFIKILQPWKWFF